MNKSIRLDTAHARRTGTTLVALAALSMSALAGRHEISEDGLAVRSPSATAPVVHSAYAKASNTDSFDRFGRSVAVSGNTVVVGSLVESSSSTGVNGDESDNSATGAGAAYVFVHDSNGWKQQAYLKASNTEANDHFGLGVGISGDTIVVGAWAEDSDSTGINGDETNNLAKDSGAAYVFVRQGSSWVQEAYLKASNAEAGDFFGSTVSICGDTIVVGALGEDSNAIGVNGNASSNLAESAGAAYVFVRENGVWSQQAYLKASRPDTFDVFGRSVAVSEDTIVVGADWEDGSSTGVNGNVNDNGSLNSGAAYVFARVGSTWSLDAYLKASNTGAGDCFGREVSVFADTVVVAAPDEDSDSVGVNGDGSNDAAPDSGAAYLFERRGSNWMQQAYLKAFNSETRDGFGSAVSGSADTVVVGAQYEDSDATGVNGNQSNNLAPSSGAVYSFDRIGGSWTNGAYLKPSNSSVGGQFGFAFGRSVALADGVIAVGAQSEDGDSIGVNGTPSGTPAPSSGAAYLFFDFTARLSVRNAGQNPRSYGALAPVLGSDWIGSVDLTTSGHPFAMILGFSAPGRRTMRGGQVVLISGARLASLPPRPGPFAFWVEPVPNDPSIAMGVLYTQAVHFGGGQPFALSNAIDLMPGY